MTRRTTLLLAATLALLLPAAALAQAPSRSRTAVRAPAPMRAPTPSLPRRPALGFAVDPGPPPVVLQVLPRSPVARAGIRRGDVLVRIGGVPATWDAISTASRRSSPGDTLEIVIRRDGREREVVVVPDDRAVVVIDADSVRAMARSYLGDAERHLLREKVPGDDRVFQYRFDGPEGGMFREGVPPPTFDFGPLEGMFEHGIPGMERFELDGPGFRFLRRGGGVAGAHLTELNAELARYFPGATQGLLVLEVAPDSPAARAGLEPGDVIVRADGHEVWNHGALAAAGGDGPLALSIVRRGETREVRVEREEPRWKERLDRDD